MNLIQTPPQIDWPSPLTIIGWIILAIIALWQFFKSQGWTWFVSRNEADSTHRRNQADAALTALAKEAATSNSQVLNLNEKYTDHILQVEKEDLRKILEQLGKMHGVLIRLESASSIRTQDWSKMTEILSDIDIVMSRLEEVTARIEERVRLIEIQLNGGKNG